MFEWIIALLSAYERLKRELEAELEAEQSFRPKVKIGYDQYDCKRVMGTPQTIDSYESQYGTTE